MFVERNGHGAKIDAEGGGLLEQVHADVDAAAFSPSPVCYEASGAKHSIVIADREGEIRQSECILHLCTADALQCI